MIQIEHDSPAIGLLDALKILNKLLLKMPNLEPMAKDEALYVKNQIELNKLTEIEVVDHLTQACIDFEMNGGLK